MRHQQPQPASLGCPNMRILYKFQHIMDLDNADMVAKAASGAPPALTSMPVYISQHEMYVKTIQHHTKLI